MFQKWFAALLIGLGIAVLLLPPALPVRAQEATPADDANCVSCHEHRYYLHDEGKYYCLCEAPMHCVYCHEGRTDSYNKDIAHEGLVLYPTRHQAERCQSCHGEDYMAYVVTFDEAGGISSTPRAIITATPAESTLAAVEVAPVQPLRFGQLDLWRQVLIGALGIGMIGMLAIGYHCWRTECRAKS